MTSLAYVIPMLWEGPIVPMVQPFASNDDVDVEYGFPCMDVMGSIIILMVSSKLDIAYDMDILNY